MHDEVVRRTVPSVRIRLVRLEIVEIVRRLEVPDPVALQQPVLGGLERDRPDRGASGTARIQRRREPQEDRRLHVVASSATPPDAIASFSRYLVRQK